MQHFVPLFARLAGSGEVDLKVFYCCDWGIREYADPGFGQTFAWNIPLLEGYQSEFLPIRRPRSLSFFEVDNPQVGDYLSSFDPDAVWIHGYGQRTSWRVLRWARRRAAVLYFGDSELLTRRGSVAKIVKRCVLPWFFRRCDGFLTIGDNNESVLPALRHSLIKKCTAAASPSTARAPPLDSAFASPGRPGEAAAEQGLRSCKRSQFCSLEN